MYDEQRLHFKSLQDTLEDMYLADRRDMATAGAGHNLAHHAFMKDQTAELKRWNKESADHDLNTTNAQHLLPSAPM